MRADPLDPTTRSHLAAIYAYSAVAATFSLLLWPLAKILHQVIMDHLNGKPAPWVTDILIYQPQYVIDFGICWMVLPFVIARLFHNRPTLVVLFQASALLYIVFVLFLFSFAALFPWVRIIGPLGADQ